MINGILGFVVMLAQIAVSLLQIIFGLIGLLISWLLSIISMAANFIASLINAQPIPIPMMPQCRTAPTVYDWCIIPYILENTFFAQGTPGALLVPIFVLDLAVFMITGFIKFVLRLVNRGERVTDVG